MLNGGAALRKFAFSKCPIEIEVHKNHASLFLVRLSLCKAGGVN